MKLADLGVSAFVGPGGFHRSNTTPTYSAPEVLIYSGREPLTEKVCKLCCCLRSNLTAAYNTR